MTLHPDQPYQKLREGLIQYEDMEAQRLLANVPNYYTSRNDQTIFGAILRVAAKELARMEYAYTYDVLSKDPSVLTPADIRREFGPALAIPREYPREDQSDLEFREFVTNLLDAFKLGTRLEGIQKVLEAYMGDGRVHVEELYKKIGHGYDHTDRNTLRIVAGITDSTPNGVSQLKTLTENLYFALDLIKPAHVGITLNTVFGDGDSMLSCMNDISDTLVIWFLGREGEPLEAPFRFSPWSDKTQEETRVSPVTTLYTSAPITLSGLGVQGGCSWSSPITEGSVVRVTAQVSSSSNGYYTAKSGAWERYSFKSGLVSPILNRAWEVQDSDPIILDLE